ncbi:tryptophan--tRNA ligase [Oscillospiraceae bacterium OttesenSCG-928-G22]|nr:tryptophan--tRNA ligase [Oscillospiraceae bacterium OttesenSCG-928-G22]
MEKKTIFSGIKPTGDLTLGSYIGALKNWIALQDEYNCFYCIVDMHSITIRNDPEVLKRRTLEQFAQYIAVGLDCNKSALYIQSHVTEHAELSWILGCYTMMGELNRMTQFKDMQKKAANNLNGGIYTYPVLMAADILLYNAHLVPVGEDQKQHVELCRNIAVRFNSVYGETFTLPEPFIPKVGARVKSLLDPESKMSKSDDDRNGSVYLMDSPDEIVKKFKRAKTDSESDVRYDPETKAGVSNLMTIYAAVTGKSFPDIEAEFSGKGYGVFKPAVAEAVVETLRPIREESERLLADPAELTRLYRMGAEKARTAAAETLRRVSERVGFVAR